MPPLANTTTSRPPSEAPTTGCELAVASADVEAIGRLEDPALEARHDDAVDAIDALDVGERARAVAREVQVTQRADVGARAVDRVAGEEPGLGGPGRQRAAAASTAISASSASRREM